MNQQVVFKSTLSVAALTALRTILPAILGVGVLYAVCVLYGVEFDDRYVVLSVLIAVLALILLNQPAVSTTQLLERHWPTAARVLLQWIALLATLLAIGYVTKFSGYFSRRALLTWAVITPAPLIFLTVALNEAMRRVMLSSVNIRNAVFAGYNEVSQALATRLRQNPEVCIRVNGYFDDRSADRLGGNAEHDLLGGLKDLAPYSRANNVEVIFIALPMRHVQRVLDLLEELHDTTVSIYYVPDVFIFDLIQSRTGDILGMPVVAMCETPFFGYRGIVKRLMDLVIASLALVALAPLLAVIAVLVKLSSPGPVIFRQRRYGLGAEEILVWKFRTMTVVEDGDRIRQATRDDERITRVGRFLRRYSLDELPQLFNVVSGNMSLVGPRPHAVAHNEEYRKLIKGYIVRHKVPPGMTGLAQVNGCRGETRSVEDMRARIEYDLEYLRQWSPLLDLKILAKTFMLVINDRKAY